MQPSFIASYVIRLFRDQATDGASGWRVVVRNVQTGEERQFQRPTEALAFLEEAASDRVVQ